MTTCSFKETEAYSVCGRIREDDDRILVVASAGNTARAFAKVCSDNNIRLLLSVPEDNISALWFDGPLNPCVKLICCERGGDYFDAISLSNQVLRSRKFYAEGGAKNVARRDGMGTTVLSAATTIGEIPDYYFQAVGSGTGAIAAWEANMRLNEDGRFGDKLMKLIVSQNAPFVPMYDAWRVDSREMLPTRLPRRAAMPRSSTPRCSRTASRPILRPAVCTTRSKPPTATSWWPRMRRPARPAPFSSRRRESTSIRLRVSPRHRS